MGLSKNRSRKYTVNTVVLAAAASLSVLEANPCFPPTSRNFQIVFG